MMIGFDLMWGRQRKIVGATMNEQRPLDLANEISLREKSGEKIRSI